LNQPNKIAERFFSEQNILEIPLPLQHCNPFDIIETVELILPFKIHLALCAALKFHQ